MHPDASFSATATKKAALLALAERRRRDPLLGYSRSYAHLADVGCDCDHVVPWTISAPNVDADLMLIAQDWASKDFIDGLSPAERTEQRATGQISDLPTNRRLKDKVLPRFGVTFEGTYATDAFAFVKHGPMNAYIPPADLVRSALAYALPQIAIVRPKMVLCLGSATFNAVRRAVLDARGRPGHAGERAWVRLSEAWRILDPFHTEYEGIPIFGVSHPGGSGTRASGGEKVTGPRLDALADFFAQRRT